MSARHKIGAVHDKLEPCTIKDHMRDLAHRVLGLTRRDTVLFLPWSWYHHHIKQRSAEVQVGQLAGSGLISVSNSDRGAVANA